MSVSLKRIVRLGLEMCGLKCFPRPSRDGRAYLLPLLAANLSPRTSDIRHFVSYFVPLSEKLFELQTSAEKEGERKVPIFWLNYESLLIAP